MPDHEIERRISELRGQIANCEHNLKHVSPLGEEARELRNRMERARRQIAMLEEATKGQTT